MKEEKDLNEGLSQEEKPNTGSTGLKETKRTLTKKTAMVLVAGLLVVAALVALGVAWYTRVVSSYAVAFDVTDYDLAVNESRDSFEMNVYSYAQVQGSKMAPGTLGWLPMELSLSYSGTDANFKLTMNSHIPEKINKHLRLFYLQEAVKVTDATYTPYGYKYVYKAFEGDALAKESDLDALLTDTNLTNSTAKTALGLGDIPDAKIDYTAHTFPKYKKVFIDTYEGQPQVEITDTITRGEEHILCIYWQWYLDADAANMDHLDDDFEFYIDDTTKMAWADMSDAQKEQTRDLWDALDVDIGRYPEKYKEAFRVSVKISAAESTPTNGVRPAEGGE